MKRGKSLTQFYELSLRWLYASTLSPTISVHLRRSIRPHQYRARLNQLAKDAPLPRQCYLKHEQNPIAVESFRIPITSSQLAKDAPLPRQCYLRHEQNPISVQSFCRRTAQKPTPFVSSVPFVYL